MFIARQPIFNRSMEVYGYELLYRESATSTYFDKTSKSSEQATATVLSGLFELGIQQMSNSKKSFINFDYDFLFSESIELIDPDDLVIEVLENTVMDYELRNRLLILKEKGYKIALDDFCENYGKSLLVPLSDIIKYDLIDTPLNTIQGQVMRARRDGKILIAEKVETKEDYEIARRMGFHLFQGFFFKKPRVVGKLSERKSPKLSYIQLLNELQRPEPSFTNLARIIKKDVNLSHRLFLSTKDDHLDSDDFIEKIHQSLVFMGLNRIERWIHILMLRDLASNKPDELVRLSLIRAYFGELLAKQSQLQNQSNEIYGMFLFSTLDALLDQPMEDALKDLSISQNAKAALISEEGELSSILKLVYAYEQGNWEKVNDLSEELTIHKEKISQFYMDSIAYSKDIMNDESRH